jgi:hypothetical protein
MPPLSKYVCFVAIRLAGDFALVGSLSRLVVEYCRCPLSCMFEFIQIRVLAHRKLLLKGIEDLKKNGKPTLQLRASPTKPLPNNHASSSSSSSQANRPMLQQAAAAPAVHWSHAKPLSENKVDAGNALVRKRTHNLDIAQTCV